jgi:hypothetical protein
MRLEPLRANRQAGQAPQVHLKGKLSVKAGEGEVQFERGQGAGRIREKKLKLRLKGR